MAFSIKLKTKILLHKILIYSTNVSLCLYFNAHKGCLLCYELIFIEIKPNTYKVLVVLVLHKL